jgi:ParB family transcriptional regulator, chromosome partitioning protein
MNKAPDTQRRALGKGLSALLPHKQAPTPELSKDPVGDQGSVSQDGHEGSSARTLPLTAIHPNPSQPRQNFDEVRIQELAASIRANGIIQPITVCSNGDKGYLIVAGERRWRAAKLAGLSTIPVYVREAEPERSLELALIENIQREDLNPIETAQAFEQLINEHQLTHEQAAERTSKDRSTITNFIRLLKLPVEVREKVALGELSTGHARAILALERLEDQKSLCDQIITRGLSVRQTEQMVKRINLAGSSRMPTEAKKERIIDANVRAAIDEMSAALGTKVRLVPSAKDAGRIEIEYYSSDDLQRIYEVIVN